MTALALFISGTGGNALNLVQACKDGRVPARPVLAVASTPKAGGIAKLEALGIPVVTVVRSRFESDEAFSEACYEACRAAGVDHVPGRYLVACLVRRANKVVAPHGNAFD